MNIGDLVMSEISGKIGIVVGTDDLSNNDYWLVMMHDSTYSISKFTIYREHSLNSFTKV